MAKGYSSQGHGQQKRVQQAIPSNPLAIKTKKFALEKNKFIIMSSHQMQSIEDYCEDLVILKNGKTILSGNLKQIKAGYGRTNLTVNCQEEIDILIKDQGINLVSKTATGYEFKIKSDEEAYTLLKKIMDSKVKLDKFEIREPSLHEIFIQKVGEQ